MLQTKVTACLRASSSPAVRSTCKYSLGLTEENQKKPHLVVAGLREFYVNSVAVSDEQQRFLSLIQEEIKSSASWEARSCNQGTQCEYENEYEILLTSSSETSSLPL